MQPVKGEIKKFIKMVVQENVCGPAAVVGEEGRGAGRLALASTGRSDGGVYSCCGD